MKAGEQQSMSFFDENEVLYPWPSSLRKNGLSLTYKPREVWWKSYIGDLNLKKGQKVLEVGCGRGILLDRITKEYQVKASGVDIAKQAIKDGGAESIYKHEMFAANACKLPFGDEEFDAVLSFDTLEHIKNQKEAVLEMIRVLKKGGSLLVYTINNKQGFTWDWFISKMGVDIYKRVDHDPKFFVNPEELKKKLEKSGLKVEKTAYFNSFFSLIADELIMIFLSLWHKFFGWKRTEKSGTIILKGLTVFSVFLTPFLQIVDLPWTVFGYSNGFLIIGQKK